MNFSHPAHTLRVSGLVLFVCVASQGVAGADIIPVPKGDFETVYKHGSTTVTVNFVGTYTTGVGPNVDTYNGTGSSLSYSDSTTAPGGTAVDIPNWTQASSATGFQNVAETGQKGVYVNGQAFSGSPNGLLVTSGSLGVTIQPGLDYTLTIDASAINGAQAAGPLALNLLAAGAALTPSSTVSPAISTTVWQTYSNTYTAASLASKVGQALTISFGTGNNATGKQLDFDNVTLSTVPEPSSMALLVLGVVGVCIAGIKRWVFGK